MLGSGPVEAVAGGILDPGRFAPSLAATIFKAGPGERRDVAAAIFDPGNAAASC